LGKQIPLNRFWPWCNGRPWCKGKVQYHGSHVHLLERIEMAKTIQNCTPQGSNKRLLTHQSPIFANCTACTCFKSCYSVFTYLALPPPVRPAGGVEGCKRPSLPVNRPGGAGGGESSKRAPATVTAPRAGQRRLEREIGRPPRSRASGGQARRAGASPATAAAADRVCSLAAAHVNRARIHLHHTHPLVHI